MSGCVAATSKGANKSSDQRFSDKISSAYNFTTFFTITKSDDLTRKA
jgi:hypothetical protein